MPNQDQKKIALITGANKGIGLETARQLARDKARGEDAIEPGSVQTTLNPAGELTVEAGAKSSVEMAIIGNDGPNGTFSHLGQPIPW